MNNIRPQTLLGEYIGTLILAFVVLASVGGLLPSVPTPILAGVTLTVVVLVFGKISGANINPAVTAGLASIGRLPAVTAVAYIASQALGAVSATGLYKLLTDLETIPSVASSTSDYRIMAAEAVGAAIFTMGIASAIYQKLEGFAAAFTIGTSLTLGILFAAVISNGVLNPAVAWTIGSFSWAYVVGPVVGGVVGMNLFKSAFTAKDKIVS